MKAFLLSGILTLSSAQQFSFGAAGDFGNGANFLATVDAVKAANVSFMLALGDLSYETNQEVAWCDKWRTRGGLSDLLITAGNHDVNEHCCGNLQSYLDACPRTIPVEGEPGIQYYVDYPINDPTTRFITITPGVKGDIESYSEFHKGDPGYVWLENAIDDARAKKIRWIVVSMHKNFVSALIYTDEVGQHLMSLLFSKRVDLILQGHEHGYERSKSLTCAQVNSYNQSCVAETNPTLRGKGSVILVLGTGGQILREKPAQDTERNYFQVVDVTTYGFGLFTVSQDKIVYAFRRSAGGDLRDSFTIKYSSSTPTNTTTARPTPAIAPTTVPAPTEGEEGEDGSYENSTRPEGEPAEVNNFDYNGDAIIAIIALFLIGMAVLGVIGIFLMIRQAHRDHAAPHLPLDDHLEDVGPAKHSVSRVSKLNKKQSEGTIDYL